VTLTAVRAPAVAGRFYPADREELRRAVGRYLAEGRQRVQQVTVGKPLRALVVPHAGYVYSGPVAGAGYAVLEAEPATVRRVWLLGPAHYVPVRGGALSSSKWFGSPLGEVLVDQDGVDLAASCPWVAVDDAAHAPEHSLEVQLPFLQEAVGDCLVTPLLVGPSDAARVGRHLAQVMQTPGTVVIVSTDLSHYLDQATARRRDATTASHVLAGEWRAIDDRAACGVWALRALLAAAGILGLDVTQLDLRTSADTAGPPDRVVGYGAFALTGGRSRP
jgi:hypothetical protein